MTSSSGTVNEGEVQFYDNGATAGTPVAVSGGFVRDSRVTAAALRREALEQDFAVPVRWAEDRSLTTWENAVFTAQLLKSANIGSVVIVTHPWHMRRALWSFERVGLHAIPYPTPLTYDESDRVDDYLPSMRALEDSYHALHEAIGLAYYRMRY